MTPRERLTPKEIQIAILVWEGLTNREIGRIIGTSEQVIKNHLRNTFDKLGVWSRLELAMYVASHGGKTWPESDGVSAAPYPSAIGADSTLRRKPILKPKERRGTDRFSASRLCASFVALLLAPEDNSPEPNSAKFF